MMPKLLQGTVVIWGWIRRAPNWYDEASAYVDGELSAPRRAAFEEALGESPQLQRYLDELQATKQGIQLLPEVELPRSFTISIAQAQGTPRLVRREPATVVGRWFGGTTMVRNAAAFSVLAGAAFAAVVAVDISGDGGGTGVLTPSLTTVASTAAAEVEQETAVAAVAPREETAQAAADQSAGEESLALAESSEQAFALPAEQAAVTQADTVTSDSVAQAALAAPADGEQAAAPPPQAAAPPSEDEAATQSETPAQEPSSEPTEAIAAAAEPADSEEAGSAEEAATEQAVEQAADEEAVSEQALSGATDSQAVSEALIDTPDEEAAPVAEQPVRESEPESASSAAPARGEAVPESPDEAVTIERVPGQGSDPEADEAAADEETAPDVDLSSLSDDDGAEAVPETVERALSATAVEPPDSAGENALIGQAGDDDSVLLILEIVFGVVLGVSLAAAALALRRRTSAS
ncbi:MAG: hypothetical protein O7A71_07520 [Chloroflexi bacterium]|nr:hypothetical protein [Chloroflexota bacterium]